MAGISSFLNRVTFIKQIPVFKSLNWFDIQKIARKATVAEYKKGDIICHQGTPPDFFYCLISGRLQAYRTNAEGHKENIEFIHRGQHFGIISVLTGENHSLNFEAINDSVILKISLDDFQNILKSLPQLGIEFSQSLSKRIRSKVTGSKSVFESTIISVYSPVKGTGSSTYAINLALSLQKETKKNVILVQIHSKNGGATKEGTSIGGLSPQWKSEAVDINELIGESEIISEKIITGEINADLLNVAFDINDADLKKHISYLVSALAVDYHYVVVDLPNETDEMVLETLTQSDVVHLISADRKKDLKQIRAVINKLESILNEKFREEKIKIIIRAVHDKVYLSFEEINQFKG